MTYKEFIADVKKVKQPRNHDIKNSYGVVDGYKYYRDNRPKSNEFKLTIKQYRRITRLINKLLCENLLQGYDIVFPSRLGLLSLEKIQERITTTKKGTVINTHPINWQKTLQLWYEDEEAKEQKFKVRNNDKVVYRIRYLISSASYKNKFYYCFNANRQLKVKLKELINQGLIDAFETKQYYERKKS